MKVCDRKVLKMYLKEGKPKALNIDYGRVTIVKWIYDK